MDTYRVALTAAVVAAAAALVCPVASAEPAPLPPPPVIGEPCAQDLTGAMTLLPDERTYAVCQDVIGGQFWSAVQTPFEPNDTWLSYGPAITLHGQGMRNPNLTSGAWVATPLDPQSVCRVQQTTVVEAGVLAPPQVSEGEPGQALSVQMLPKLFYSEMSGNCVWAKE